MSMIFAGDATVYGMADHPQEVAEPKKRQVSYNPEAVLCPTCKKRIRLNNNGRIRVHAEGKMGSEQCPGSNTFAKAVKKTKGGAVQASKTTKPSVLFSDLES